MIVPRKGPFADQLSMADYAKPAEPAIPTRPAIPAKPAPSYEGPLTAANPGATRPPAQWQPLQYTPRADGTPLSFQEQMQQQLVAMGATQGQAQNAYPTPNRNRGIRRMDLSSNLDRARARQQGRRAPFMQGRNRLSQFQLGARNGRGGKQPVYNMEQMERQAFLQQLAALRAGFGDQYYKGPAYKGPPQYAGPAPDYGI